MGYGLIEARTTLLAACCTLVACSAGNDGKEPQAKLRAETAALQLSRDAEDGSLLITPDGALLEQNPVYRELATSILRANPSGGAAQVDAARLRSQALDQTLYPQFQPTAAINENGDPIARLAVSQILFSNGQFQAEKGTLRAAEIEAVATYLIDANQRVADAVSTYFEADYYRRLTGTAQELEVKYRTLLDQAERRVAGGVGDETEVATFKLKLLEAQSDIQTNRSNQRLAEARLRDLTSNLALPQVPPALRAVAPNAEPPEIVRLMAQIAGAESEIELERARRRPSLSVEAFTERDLATGQTDDGLSLGVGVSVPLGVRNDLQIKAAEANRNALETDLAAAKSDVARRVSQLSARIQSETARLETLRGLVAAAKARIEKFDEQFLSGAVSIEEAVSVLETYRRSQDQLVDARNEMLKAQLEIARIYGQLHPGET